MTVIKILKETAETVTVSKADWSKLMDALEDAEDIAAISAARAFEDKVGKETARRNYLPIEMVERILAGERPLKVYREHNKLTVAALSEISGVSGSYISEIENGRKRGSVDAMKKLSRALGLAVDDLLE